MDFFMAPPLLLSSVLRSPDPKMSAAGNFPTTGEPRAILPSTGGESDTLSGHKYRKLIRNKTKAAMPTDFGVLLATLDFGKAPTIHVANHEFNFLLDDSKNQRATAPRFSLTTARASNIVLYQSQ
jgi:hypothetical protein